MPVPKTRCIIERAGQHAHYDCDTVFIDGIPHIVFEWQQTPEGEKPAVVAKLDPQYFHDLPGWGEVKYLYENPVKDPRPSN